MYILANTIFFWFFMSVFKTTGIVLQVWKYSENELFYKIFFRDYGILTVKKRKKAREKPIDIGYFISCEIVTHHGKTVHTIGNIKIQSFFETKQRTYSEIEAFLRLLSRLKKEIPEWHPHHEIYDIISWCINTQDILTDNKILLIHLKIISSLWSLWDAHSDEITQKTLKFIHKYNYKEILKLWEIPQQVLKNLEHML